MSFSSVLYWTLYLVIHSSASQRPWVRIPDTTVTSLKSICSHWLLSWNLDSQAQLEEKEKHLISALIYTTNIIVGHDSLAQRRTEKFTAVFTISSLKIKSCCFVFWGNWQFLTSDMMFCFRKERKWKKGFNLMLKNYNI